MVEWTEGRMDSWINRQIDKQTACHKFTIVGPTLTISTCNKNTGRGRNDQFKIFELEVDHYFLIIECIVNVD